MEFTVEHARKILNVVDQGLVKGLGIAEPGKMCVEAAICYSLGLSHGDDPGCVAPAVRAFKIQLNDSRWSSNAARAKGLRALAIAQIGSLGHVDNTEFIRRLAEKTIRVIVPIALRKVGLEESAVRCECEGTQESAYAAAATAASATARATATARAAAAASATARAAAHAADAADDYADVILQKSADLAFDILREMGAPGVALWDAVNV